MAKGTIKEGSEADLRVTIERVWPDGQITVYIQSATAGQRVTLLNDNDIIDTFKGDEPRRPTRRRDKLL